MSTDTHFHDVSIDRVRAFWDARPCNIRHSDKPVGTKEYFDEVEARKYLVEPHILEFAEFPRWQGKRVLEVGCGLGTDTINFARSGAQVTAIDLSDEAVKLTTQRATVYGLDRQIEVFQYDAENLDDCFATERYYDLVYSFGVLHHTPHPERALDRLRYFLDDAGVLKIMLYHRRSWKALEILAEECRYNPVLMAIAGKDAGAFDTLIATYSEAQAGCPVTYTYTPEQAIEMLDRCGFETTDVRIEHIFPYRVKDYIEKRHIKQWQWRFMPDSLFHWLEHKLGWHLCITARKLERTA